MRRTLLCVSLLFLMAGCVKRHRLTVRVCDTLYVEDFNVNVAGVDAEYLTDSLNFRIYIGKFDADNEFYTYRCVGEDIFIEKIRKYERYSSKRTLNTIEKNVFKLNDLQTKYSIR